MNVEQCASFFLVLKVKKDDGDPLLAIAKYGGVLINF